MNGSRGVAAIKGGLLFALLLGEIYAFHQSFPETRIFVFDTLSGFRLIKVLIAVAGLVALLAVLPQSRARLRFDGSVAIFLPIHLASAAVFWWQVESLWLVTLSDRHTLLAATCWALGCTVFAGSWVLCLSSLTSLSNFLSSHGLVIVALALGLTPLINFAESFWTGSFVFATFYASSQLAMLFFDEVDVDVESLVFGVPEFKVNVGHLCSGFEGMALIFGFLCVYLWLRRDSLKFPDALVLLPIGVIASWLMNILRIVSLVSLGALVDPDLAVGAFHSQAGWISFLLLAFGLIALVERSGLLSKSRVSRPQFPVAHFLVPLGAQLFLTLLFSAFSDGFDIYYPVRTLAIGFVLWGFREPLCRLNLLAKPSFASLAIGIAVYAVWVSIIPEAEGRPLVAPAHIAAIWLLFRLVGSVVIVPIIEELAFRGYLLRRLQARWFEDVPIGQVTAVSALVSSFFFGLLHSAVLAGTLAGLGYTLALWLRGRISDAIYAHAVSNLCIAVHVIVFGRWDLWS